MHIPFFQGKR